MGNKSNSLSRVERHQREKVLRFSIRKYSFGAASVAVAALMFLGARVASADSVIENNSQNTTDVVKQKEKDKSLAEIQQPTDNKVEAAQNPSEKEMATNIESVVKAVDKANLRKVVEELNATLSSKSNLDNSVISPIKDRVQKGQALLDSDTATQKDVNDLLSLLENDLTVLSNATKESSKVQETTTENKTEIRDNKTASELSEADKTISDKKESLKLSAEQLQAVVLELPEHESTKEVFEKANELLGLAQGVIQSTTVSLTDVEQMNKLVKRMFISVKNATTRLSSGSRDPRNGQRMSQGTGERAAAVSQTWTSEKNILSYQRFRVSDTNGDLQNANRQLAESKVDMTARFETINGSKYVVYDVFFNNNGRVIGGSTHQVMYKLILQPEILDLNSNGTYKGDTLRDLKFEIYRKNRDVGTLSQNPGNFSKTGTANFDFLNEHEKTKEGLTYYYNLDIRHNGSYGLDMRDTFKSNKNDPFLEMAVSRNGVYNNYSYGFGVTTLNDRDAVHMQVKAKLKSGVTEEKVKEAYTLAVVATHRPTTNQSYVFVSGRNARENYTNVPDRPVVPTVKQSEEYPIKGKEVTKIVGDSIENVSDPVASGFVVRNNDSKNFPNDMSWSWTNGQPNTNSAGIFKYNVTATYYDNSSNSTTATLKVNPKKPVITASDVEHKKGLTGQSIRVNVGSGVKAGSTVKLYDGSTVIGTGKTTGETATVTVSGALSGNPITAETIVNNGGEVTSVRSDAVRPTEAPDSLAPTVKIVDKTRNNAETTLTDNVSNAPTIDVYRGANLELPLKYYDNDRAGKVNIQYVSGLPSGVSFNQNASATIKELGKTENAQGSYTVRGRVDANAPLGITTVTLKVSDAANGDVNQGNKKEVKFRVRVLDLDFEQGVSEQTGVAKISREVELNRPVGDPNNYLTVNDGSQRSDRLFPSGMTFRFIRGTEYKTNLTYTDPGKYTEKAAAFYPTTYVPTNGESVTATNATGDKVDEIRGRAYVARDIEFQVKPTAPTVTPQENGDVIVSHTNQRNVNTLSFTYTNGNGAQQTVTATKNGNSWTLDNPSIDGVTIDTNTGAVTIKDRAVRDTAEVTAKVATSDRVNSNDTTATAKAGERIAPTFEFNSRYTEVVNGQRVVYVTPTENLSDRPITLGTVRDNSDKLLETVLFHGNGTSYNLEYGLTYNDKPRTTNGDFNAPHDIVIKGTVPKINPNTSRIWDNDMSLVTRYVSAMDAAENQLKNQSDQNSNPLRVQFKILSQAAKYNPQVATQTINKDVTANGARLSDDEFNAIKSNITFTANKGDVRVAYNTPNMNITMNENGAVKRNSNGTYYVGATVNYPDGTSETIQIPVEKSDKIPPTVKMNGKELTENAADNHFIIYRGANFNPTFEVNDDSGVTTYLKADGIPNGVWFNRQGERDFPKTENMRNGTQYQLTTNNTVDSTAPLGEREARVTVKDALNNEKTYKFKYTIVDVDVKDSPKNVRLNSQLGDPHHFLTTTAANRVNSDDTYFPGGMQFKWIKNNQEVAQSTTLPKAGNVTDYTAVAEFANGATSYVKNIDGKDVTIYTPARVGKPVTFIVTEDSPPTVKMTNPSDNRTTELSGDDSNSPIVTIYRNGQLDIPLSFYDNEATGRVNLQYVEGLPKGVTFSGTNNTVSVTGAVANANRTHTISGRVAADATLGMSTVTMKVSDGANGVASGNQGEVKFRIRVLDVDFEEARSPEPNQSSITVEANVGINVPDPNHYLTVNDGTNRTDQGNFPSGMTFRYVSSDGSSTTRTLQYNAPGQYTVKARAYFPVNYAGTKDIGEVVSGQTGDNTEINGRRYIEKTIVFRIKPTTPVVAPQDNGDVVITQRNETNVNRLSVTYTTQGDNPQEVTYTAAKNGDTWSFGSNVPITIDSTTGTVKIKDRLVQDGSTVKVKAITGDGILSDEGTGDAKPGDPIYPTVDFQNTETDAEGYRVVYITPTEDTNIPVATLSDNSGKLVSADFVTYSGFSTDLRNANLDFSNRFAKDSAETQHVAPVTLNITGKLAKQNPQRQLWTDGERIAYIWADAEDAAGNRLHGSPGTKETSPNSRTIVKLAALTQATKYTPTVSTSKIERDITQANTTITDAEFNKIKDTLTFSSTRGEVKVDKNTSGLSLVMKNSTVQTKQDGSLYIAATVTYPDGSREDIEVPLDTTNANKAKPTLTIPEVSVKAAKVKDEQGSVPATEYNRVLNNVTVPQGQPQPTAKEVKNNGRISLVDGKNVVTVGLTFSDNTKKDVTVPVLEVKPIDITTTFNELDNTVTVKPNTTVENGDKLHVAIRGVGMQLTKTATGYTNSRNDRDITVNSDGSITISLLGNETFQAGDRVVTRHESNKNGQVDSYETEAFAGLKPVEKVPVLEVTALTNEEKEDVKAAVKKANPSVNVDELQVAANGDVTYTHRGEGVGENDPAQTFTLRDNVIRKVLAAQGTNPTDPVVEGQPYTNTDVVVTANKPGATISSTPVHGLSVNGQGQITGTPSFTPEEWGTDEEKTVTIPVTVSREGDTPVTVNVEVKVLRDTDGDGTPDVRDDDDDNDGISDRDEEQNGTNPKVKTALTAEPHNPTTPVVEGQPYTNTDVVVTSNKTGVTISSTPSHGLSVNGQGQITGTPSFTPEEWGTDEEKTVTIPVTVSREGDTPVTVNVEVKVLRDTDGDGTPDKTDTDDDGDGIDDNQDSTPKVKTALTSGKVTPTNPAVEGQPYTSKEKVINPNKPGTTVTPTPTNGLTIDGTSGKVTGTPTGLTWNGDDTEQTVNIPVVIRKGNETVNETIPVVVQRDVTKTPTFTVGNQDPTDGHVDVTVSGVPDGTKVTLPGVNGEKVVTGGKVTLTNDELPETPQTGKGRAQENGKLPKEGTSDITIPGKISSSKGEPEVQTETPDYTNTIPVTPVKPATNGGSGQDTPAPSPTTPTTDAVTPNADQVDTKPTNDNGAKSNDSQNVLPNTGTESNATLASLGLLGLLSGFGLVARKKKED